MLQPTPPTRDGSRDGNAGALVIVARVATKGSLLNGEEGRRRRRCFAWTVFPRGKTDTFNPIHGTPPRLQEPGGNFYRSRDSPRAHPRFLSSPLAGSSSFQPQSFFSLAGRTERSFLPPERKRQLLSFLFSSLRCVQVARRQDSKTRPGEKCHRVSLTSLLGAGRERSRGLKMITSSSELFEAT